MSDDSLIDKLKDIRDHQCTHAMRKLANKMIAVVQEHTASSDVAGRIKALKITKWVPLNSDKQLTREEKIWNRALDRAIAAVEDASTRKDEAVVTSEDGALASSTQASEIRDNEEFYVD